MGFWNATLYSNDTTQDVRDTYIDYLKKHVCDEMAYQNTYDEYRELIGTEEEPLFWYAMADVQWNVGRLTPEVKAQALKWINIEGGMSMWEEHPHLSKKWRETLQKLCSKLETPVPNRKKYPKPREFVKNPWNVGDVYAYQFHTKEAEENGLYGKYILMQKIGNVEFYAGSVFSVIQIYDCVFENIPELDILKDIRYLPLIPAESMKCVPPEKHAAYIHRNTRTTMIYDRINDYPRKYLTFVGRIERAEEHYRGNKIADYIWYKIEQWLVPFYTSWQGVLY